MSKLKWNQIVCGSNPEALKPIPDETISCVMTSFPYWGQRDYKVKGQMGLEKHYSEWLEKAWLIMDEVQRVLRPDGTCWINLGDKYGGSGGDHKPYHNNKAGFQGKLMRGSRATNPMDKSLLFIPERFAIGCLDRGWTIPMPSSGKGRFTNTYEYLYFMVKNTKPLFFVNTATRKTLDKKPPKHKQQINRDWKWRDETKRKRITLWRGEDYFFDLDNVRCPHAESTHQRLSQDISKQYQFSKSTDYSDNSRKEIPAILKQMKENLNPAGKNPGDVITYDQKYNQLTDKAYQRKVLGVPHDQANVHPAGANPGDFWSIPTQPSKLPHYASYPEKLCETPLKAGCPKRICKECGMARVRVTKNSQPPEGLYTKSTQPNDGLIRTGQRRNGKFRGSGQKVWDWMKDNPPTTIGWSFCFCLCPACGEADCKCGEKWRPGIVEDPFCGIGTTLIVAKKLGLWYHGIDIKQEYVDMSVKRLKDVKYQEVFDYDQTQQG